MEPLEVDTLYLAATRPALFMGVPLIVAVAFMMLGGFIIVLLENPLYELVLIPLWLAAQGFGVAGLQRRWRRHAVSADGRPGRR